MSTISTALTALALALSIAFSARSTSGCDFIQLHFKALNDNGIYFNKDECYIGLGFSFHQQLDNKSSVDWINDDTCYEYDEVSTGMFLNEGGNFHAMKKLLQSSRTVDILAMTLLLVMGLFSLLRNAIEKMSNNQVHLEKIPMREDEDNKDDTEAPALSPVRHTPSMGSLLLPLLGHVIILAMIIIAMHLHSTALSKLNDEGGICDHNTYFPDGWYDKYPLQYYRDYAYFKFFHECEMGEDGMHSITSKKWQIVAIATSCVSLFMNVLHAALSWGTLRASESFSGENEDESVGTFNESVINQFPLEMALEEGEF